MERREFLHAGAAGLAAAGLAAGAEDEKKYRVGVIGCGWFGNYDLDRLRDVAKVEVVSMCDVDTKHLQESADRIAKAAGKKPKTFADYKKMLAAKDLDLVIVGTPDHWHALAMIAAVEAGAHVYVEKPISVDVAEGQAMVRAARKHKRVVQVGLQRRSTDHIVKARQFVQDGKLGKVALARAYCYYHMRARKSPPDTKPPKHLDFDAWTGPAPLRKYNELMHPRGWRNFMEYGNGILGDMGVHMLDVARFVLDLRAPKRVFSTGGILVDKASKANNTDTQTVTYDFGPQTVVWEHRTWGRAEDPRYMWGVNFYGTNGTLQLNLDRWEFTPTGAKKPKEEAEVTRDKELPENDRNIRPANRAHWKDFLAAIAKGGKPVADVEEGHISTAMCVLGNVSQKLGRSLTWDAEKGVVVGDAEATKLLKRPYREGYAHPAG